MDIRSFERNNEWLNRRCGSLFGKINIYRPSVFLSVFLPVFLSVFLSARSHVGAVREPHLHPSFSIGPRTSVITLQCRGAGFVFQPINSRLFVLLNSHFHGSLGAF